MRLVASMPPATADWWARRLYADNDYPTPYGHLLITRMVVRRLGEAGWI